MCVKGNNFILCQPPVDAIQSFQIEDVLNEMKQMAPYTLTLLRGCLDSQRQKISAGRHRQEFGCLFYFYLLDFTA